MKKKKEVKFWNDSIQESAEWRRKNLSKNSSLANVSGGTFTIDDMKKAFMAGADKKYWTKIHLTGVVSGQDYELEPVFEKWFENYR
jgi:hypothetical protein